MQFDTASTITFRQRTNGVRAKRRQLLALLISVPSLLTLARAAELPATAAGDEFITLTKFATGRSKVDSDLATQLFAALRESDDTFAGAVTQLAADVSSGKYPDVESLELATRGTPKHAALLSLVSAWYTGTVSVKGRPQFITLNGALLYEPIADGSHIPGNCAGGTNSWANQPTPALSAMPQFS